MKRFAAILVLGMTCVAFGQTPPKQPALTPKQRSEIESIVKRETYERIVSIERELGFVVVRTQSIPPRVSTSHVFRLKRTDNGWSIYEVQSRSKGILLAEQMHPTP